MKRYACLFLAVGIVMSTDTTFAQKKRSGNPHAPGEDIYKHYTGTIGPKQITLDLMYGYQGSSNYGGSWYYSPDENKLTQFVISEPASFEHNIPLQADEYLEDTSLTNPWPNRGDNMPTWNFTIKEDKLKGRWKSGDGKRNYTVDLTEDYSASVHLELFVRHDTSIARDESGRAPKIFVSFVGIKPATECSRQDAEFISSEALKFLPGNQSTELEAYYTSYIRKYLSVPDNGWTTAFFVPVYNDHNLLVLKERHRKTGSQETESYLSLDMKSHKRLMPEDMLDVSNAKLSALLESAARKKYGFTPGIKLSTWLVRDKIAPTKNFYPGHKGFYFTYNAGELAKSKAITLFLPYEQVEDMMPKGFKKRVG